MKELANRLAMQHLVNAYSQETGKVSLFEKYQQNSTQLAFSQGLTLLSLPLSLIQAQLFVPLSYVSRVGRHRIADLPQIFQKGQKLNFSAAAMVSLLLEELVQQSEGHVDAASLVERWIQSRDALQQFLNIRAEDFDALVQAKQSFIESEQALILGHSMHPAPKSRTGFVHEDWQKYSPEACGQTQLHYWLVASEYIAEGTALEQVFSIQLKQEIKWHLSESELETLAAYAHYKLLPLHPWQARYLQSKVWFKSLKAKLKIIDLGEKAWIFSPTTSVRTLASFNAPWMLKPSLSVMITNSIRVNLAKECHRGEMTHRLWHSELGQSILKQCPSLKAVNDPAWIALQLDGEIIDETICIVRDQPFTPEQQVTCIASLCQDHPVEERNRFNALFDQIASQQKLEDKAKIALDWFKTFLNISLSPLMYVYHRYGMAFESHQQNVLVELKDGWPQWLWLRDNQGFYYIEELADEILQQFPELHDKAHAVGSKTFVDERFSYYFFGNTLFGIINAIGATGFVSEQDLLSVLQQHLFDLLKQYPESSLIQSLLYQPTLPYKGNLLTRLYELDELIAPVENQSVYIQLANPLYIKQEDALYA
ncbi:MULTISPECIES: IucA/IucC family protein [Acinetobacter]|uniref:Siderophore biosynthesis protein n=1 Tax=Acinetobacter johnsonii TaxID=40214 RepID=A0AAW6RTB3_ACIJO|nr:IucA/IucC family protein [Acinetobacter johnsonii]MDG9786825.1 siderophore biosynthesis protein [Acinetobacter johnsonii]MDG9798396.1 siderophore biosynthesis protein [Acinetobacter johnsonii]MDH1240910.1 siderophore biosynthesis protein [Acinetobacter johnsonii]RZN86084.1 siderophore biosynthesis protein [Acinetobacter johnsonii]